MNCVRCFKTGVLLVSVLTSFGCESGQKQPGTPQNKTAPPAAIIPEDKPVTPAVPPQDKADAQASALRVLALLESGDFPAIYKDSADGFKEIGSESQFIAKFQQTRKSVGVLKNPREISFGVLPGKGYIIVYHLENERYKTDMRLSFARSKSGKMELAGLNQHDELKK